MSISPYSSRLWVRWLAIVVPLLLLTAMWQIHPLAGAALPIAALLLLCYLFWEVTGPLLFTVVLFLRPGELFHPAFKSLQLGKLTAAACLVFCLFHFFLLKERRILRDSLSLLMVGLTAVIVLCSFKSTDPLHSQMMVKEVWWKIVLLFFAIAYLTTQRRSFVVYVTSLLSLCVVLSAMGIHKGLTATSDQLVEGSRIGLGVLLGDPNDFSQMLVATSLPYLLNCVFLAPKRRLKVAFVGLLLIVLTAIGMTRSRGGFLGFAGSTMAVLQSRVSVPVLVVSGIGLSALGAGYVIWGKRYDTSGQLDESAQGRLGAWKGALRMYVHHPVFGVGFDCYPQNYLAYTYDPIEWKPKAVHSSWLKVVAELGTLGSLFFFPLVLLSWVRARSLGRWAREQQLAAEGAWFTEALFRSLAPALVGWAIAGTFLSNSFSWFLYIQIALIIAASSIRRSWQAE